MFPEHVEHILKQAGKRNKFGFTALLLLCWSIHYEMPLKNTLNYMTKYIDILIEKEAGVVDANGFCATDVLFRSW